jgi:hypothetical protein
MSSAQIIQLFRAAAFDPESVATLSAAYDLATRRLHDRDRRPALVNEIIAQRIIDLAEKGERSRCAGQRRFERPRLRQALRPARPRLSSPFLILQEFTS